VTGTDPAYTVTVTLTDPDSDGAVAIHVDNSVQDQANNHFGGQTSPFCHVYNWRQPWFSEQPVVARKYVGDTQEFSAKASCGAATITYQWRWTAAKADGPAAPNWTLPNLSKSQRGEYWCEAFYDGLTRETGHVMLYVEDHLEITGHPLGADKLGGQSHAFTVTTKGGYGPLSYQWRKNGTVVPNATGATYELTGLMASDSGAYSVEVFDINGDTAVSETAVLAVTQGVPATNLVSLLVMMSFMSLAVLRLRRKR